MNGNEQIGLGYYEAEHLTSGILIPRHGLEPLSEAFADIVRFVGLDPTPNPGQERLL